MLLRTLLIAFYLPAIVGLSSCDWKEENNGSEVNSENPPRNSVAIVSSNNAIAAFNPVIVPIAADARNFVSTADFTFLDSKGKSWVAPRGTKTDGLSIPQACMSLIGNPMRAESRPAALVHDAYCAQANKGHASYQKAPWRDVHRMFYDALLTGKTPPMQAKIMYAAVYLCGPRWTANSSGSTQEIALTNIPQRVRAVATCIRWIQATNPNFNSLDKWMNQAEQLVVRGKNVYRPDSLVRRMQKT